MTDWQRIVGDHGPIVFGAAWRVLGNAADAEDVAQEVFLQVYRQFHLSTVRNWPGLLCRLATCRALDCLRKRKSLVELADELPCRRAGPEDDEAGRELAERLRHAVCQLAPQEAEVFCLRYFEELPNMQIAELLDLDPGAVGVALHKARRRLEEILDPAGVRD